MTYRSPLRYPGGKQKALRHILPYIPDNIDQLCSPFLGGASIELACAEKGITVAGSDSFEPLVNFWQIALSNKQKLVKRVRGIHPLTKAGFYWLRSNYDELDDPISKAAAYFALNRTSFSGTAFSGGMSEKTGRFTASSIDRLGSFDPDIDLFQVELADYRVALNRNQDSFLYLDPPYANDQLLYGVRGDKHSDFDHEELADMLGRRDGWVMSYNNCEYIRKMYSKFQLFEPMWSYGMRTKGDQRSKELLIVNT